MLARRLTGTDAGTPSPTACTGGASLGHCRANAGSVGQAALGGTIFAARPPRVRFHHFLIDLV